MAFRAYLSGGCADLRDALMTSTLGHFFREYAATAMNRAHGALIHNANSQGQFTGHIHTVVVPYPMHSLGVRPFQDAVPELFQTGSPEQFQRGSPELFQTGCPEQFRRGSSARGALIENRAPDSQARCRSRVCIGSGVLIHKANSQGEFTGLIHGADSHGCCPISHAFTWG